MEILRAKCNTGEIPASLGELANLTRLRLHKNKLSGKNGLLFAQLSRLGLFQFPGGSSSLLVKADLQ